MKRIGFAQTHRALLHGESGEGKQHLSAIDDQFHHGAWFAEGAAQLKWACRGRAVVGRGAGDPDGTRGAHLHCQRPVRERFREHGEIRRLARHAAPPRGQQGAQVDVGQHEAVADRDRAAQARQAGRIRVGVQVDIGAQEQAGVAHQREVLCP